MKQWRGEKKKKKYQNFFKGAHEGLYELVPDIPLGNRAEWREGGREGGREVGSPVEKRASP